MSDCNLKQINKNFTCTGSDESATWKKLHALPKKMNCQVCADHADIEFKGLHDHVNLGLGKKSHYPKLYNQWVQEVNSVHEQCKKDGRC